MQLHVRIYDEDLIRAFRRLAVVKFGKSRGSLSMAMEEAMRMWVARHLPDAHTNSGHKNLPAGITGRRFRDILIDLRKMIKDDDGVVRVSWDLFAKAVGKHAGFDRRTVSKYVKYMELIHIVERDELDRDYYYLYINKLKEVLEA